jgi:hypothetical protein
MGPVSLSKIKKAALKRGADVRILEAIPHRSRASRRTLARRSMLVR